MPKTYEPGTEQPRFTAWVRSVQTALYRVGVAIGGLLLFYQVFQGTLALQNQTVHIGSPVLLIVSVGLLMATTYQQMVAWQVLMRGLGVRVPGHALVQGYMLSFLPRYIPGSVWGYVSRSQWLHREYGTSYAVAHQGSLMEIITAVTASLLVIALNSAAQVDWRVLWLIIPLLLAAAAGWPRLKKAFHLSRAHRLLHARVLHALPQRIPFPEWLSSLGLITLNMLLYGVSLYAACRSLGMVIPLSISDLLAFSFMSSAAWLAGFLVFFLPSGLGLREVTLSALLTYNYGLSFETSSAVSVLFRLVASLSELLWIAVALFLQGLGRRSGESGGN